LTLSRPIGPFASVVLAVPFAIATLLASAASISAAGPIKLGVTPVGDTGSHFTLTMRPGDSRDLAVKLGNFGAEPVLARTFAADAYSLVNGGFAARLDGEPSTGTTGWLDYPVGDMNLAPGAAIERDFTVRVPANTQPGEYLTSIVLQNADATDSNTSGQGGMTLKQIVRTVVAVSIEVPGPRTPALGLGAITHRTVADRSTLAVAVHNLGNVRLTPTGEFVLWDSAGSVVTRFPIVMDTVYAHTDTFAEVPLSERLKPGDYTAELHLTDASGLSATSSNMLLTIPDAVSDTIPQPIGARPPSVATANQTPAVPGVATKPTSAAPAQARSNQAPIGPATSTDPWLVGTIGVGAGLGLLLTVAGVGFARHRRRRRTA
jgi:hypothetical protein